MADIAQTRAAAAPPPSPGRRWSERDVPLALQIGAWIGFVILLLPVVIVVLAGLNSGDYLTFPPEGLSFRWVVDFLTSETWMGAYLFSLLLALITMAISTILGTMAAIVLARYQFPGRDLVRAYFLSPLILPGVVLGLALYVFFVTTNLGLARSLAGLVIGHVLVTCPYVIGTVSAALVSFDQSLEEAARSLGARPWTAFRRITLPNISAGMMAGAIFAFIVSFGQFDVSLFLSTPDLTPLPIALYISLRYTFEPTAAAAGIFAILLVVVSMLLTARLVNMRKFGGIKFS
jgi:putative spermidine/putrescine transport system permease protein